MKKFMKRFLDLYINKEHRFSLGVEEATGKFYISIPVSNSMVDYEEFYEIDERFIKNHPENLNEIKAILKKCRDQKNDENLFYKPGRDRGEPT